MGHDHGVGGVPGVGVPDGEGDAATRRLTESGLITLEENSTECCYALQDKVWVRGPGNEPWEVYTVKADSDHLEKATGSTCCATS